MSDFYVTTISNSDSKIVFKTLVVHAASPDLAAELAISEGHVIICVDHDRDSADVSKKAVAFGINSALASRK